jgi:hypothetical protein
MSRNVAFSRTTTAWLAIAWLALGSTLLLTTATFADDDGSSSAAGASASADGGSSGGAASSTNGTEGGGNPSAGVVSTTETSATVTDTTAPAETTTQAAAATSQSTGGPKESPSIRQAERGKFGNRHKGTWGFWGKNKNWKNKETLRKGYIPGRERNNAKNQVKPKDAPRNVRTGQATAAGVKTKVHVKAYNNGKKPIADAYANAKAGAVAVDHNGPSTSVAVTGSESTATAHAEGGDKPTAYATAGSDIYALAVAGEDPYAEANAGEGALTQSQTVNGESWAISYVAGGQYTVAVATKDTAKAYASTYGAGTSFTADDVWAAALTWASAYAEANNLTATAWANAGGVGSAGTSGGVSVAAAASHGSASIRIELVRHNGGPSGGSSGSVSVQCSVKVTDWAVLRSVRPEERHRYMSCTCPHGWENAPGINRYSCVRVANKKGASLTVKDKTRTVAALFDTRVAQQ